MCVSVKGRKSVSVGIVLKTEKDAVCVRKKDRGGGEVEEKGRERDRKVGEINPRCYLSVCVGKRER